MLITRLGEKIILRWFVFNKDSVFVFVFYPQEFLWL